MSKNQMVNNLIKIRKQRKMSQGDLGKAVGKDQSAISEYETGKKKPTLESIEKLAKALSVDVSEITGYKAPNPDLIMLNESDVEYTLNNENALKYILLEMKKQTKLLEEIRDK